MFSPRAILVVWSLHQGQPLIHHHHGVPVQLFLTILGMATAYALLWALLGKPDRIIVDAVIGVMLVGAFVWAHRKGFFDKQDSSPD